MRLSRLKKSRNVPPTDAELFGIATDGAELWDDKARCALFGAVYACRKRSRNPDRPFPPKLLAKLKANGDAIWRSVVLSGIVPIQFIAHPDAESVRRMYEVFSRHLSDVLGPDPNPWTRPAFRDIGEIPKSPAPKLPGPDASLDELGVAIRALHEDIERGRKTLASACPGHQWSPWRMEISADVDELADPESGPQEAALWMHGASHYVQRHCYLCGKSEIRVLRDPADIEKARASVRAWFRTNAPALPKDWESRDPARTRAAECDAKFLAGTDDFVDPDEVVGDWTPGDPFGAVNDVHVPGAAS